jgi:GDP-L-fucose synthase
MISKVVDYSGEIVFNENRPNGTLRKLLDSSKIAQIGWAPQVKLEDGIVSTYDWFLEHYVKEPTL